MARHRRGFDSDGPSAEATSYNTVFVDTCLDTHLVLIVSSSDTVSDFKKKILLQHSESFPRIGGVKIHSVQVKRQGHFYHLPDSMLVSSAFNGSKKTWFLFVEASCSEEDEKEQLSHKLDDASENCSLLHWQNHSQGNRHNNPVDDPLKLAIDKVPQAVQTCPRHFSGEISRDISMEVEHLQDGRQKELCSDVDKNLVLPGTVLEKNIGVSENAARSEDDDSRDNNKTTMVSGLDELPSSIRKHKIEHIENVEFTMKKKYKVEDKKDPLVDASGKVRSDVQTRKIRGELYDTLSSDANWMSISGAQKTSESETNAEQSGEFQREDVDRDQSNSTTRKHVTTQEKVPSSQEVKEDYLVTGVGSNKEKKKQKKILSVPHDQVATSEPNPVLDASVFQPNLNTEAPEANKNKGHAELVLTDDPEVMVSKRCKPLGEGEADGTNDESIPSHNFMETSSATEAVDSVKTKMKKTRTKKKAPGSTREGTKIKGAISSTVAYLSVPHDQVATSEPNPVLDASVFRPNLNTEAPEANKNKGHVELVLTDDPEVMVSKICKPLGEGEGEADGTNVESIPSPNFMETSSATEAVDSVKTKMKKTRTKKKAPGSPREKTKIKGAISSTVADLAPKNFINDRRVNDQSMLSLDESRKNIAVEKERVLSHNHDPQEQPSESFKPSEQVEAPEMNKGSILSCNLSLANEVAEAGNSGTIKRKKRKAKNSAAKLQDKSDVDNLHETSLPPEGVVLDVETNDATTKKNKTVPHIESELENDRELSSRYRSEVVLTEGNKLLDSGKATVNDKESGFAEMSLDDKYGSEAGKSGRSHKKKRVKKPPTTNDDISALEHPNPVNDSPAKHFEGDTGLSLHHGPEMISSEANKTLDLGEVTVNHSESGFTSQALDNEDGTETWKSGGGQKKKRAKKSANSVCDAPAKHFASEAQGNQSIFSCTEEKKKLKKESRDASISHASKGNEASKSKKMVSQLAETDQTWETAKDLNDNLREAENDQSMDTSALQDQPVKLQANEVQHLLHDEADKEQENSENIKKKVKKTKRKQNKAVDTHSNSKTKGQNISIEELAVSGDKMGDRDHPYNTMNTNVSAETGTGDEGINFRCYFVPEHDQNENASANKVKESLHSTEAKRKTKKPNFVSDGTVKSNLRRHNDNQLEESSADAKANQDMPGANKEIPQASGNVVKASESHDVDKEKTPWKATKPVVANGFGSSGNKPWLEENNGSVAASSSSSSAKGSKRAFQDTTNKKQPSGFNNDGTSARKFSNKNGDIVNCSQQQKSLLSAPCALFNDDSSESSGEENRFGNSDASTCTPSDNSSSSGNSDGESELSQDSRGNGSENAKMEDGGRKSTLNSEFPDPKDLHLGTILMSSKRFKKAKLTASQSQEADTESQPVEFVPDSQAS